MPDAARRFTKAKGAEPINANDMIMVFASGWLGFAGTAARRASDFLPPDGFAFKEVVKLAPDDFGANAFVASEILYKQGKELQFGSRSSEAPPRRKLTRFLFYYVFVQLAQGNLA